MEQAPIPFEGDASLRPRVLAALDRVVDPEMALSITSLGLVYGIHADPAAVTIRLTMTSAACPVSEIIVEEITQELERVLPAGAAVAVELVWEPPWSPERMSAAAKRALGW